MVFSASARRYLHIRDLFMKTSHWNGITVKQGQCSLHNHARTQGILKGSDEHPHARECPYFTLQIAPFIHLIKMFFGLSQTFSRVSKIV